MAFEDSPEKRDDQTATTNTENAAGAEAYLNGEHFDFLKVVRSARVASMTQIAALQKTAWMNAHRFYRNQHIVDSKYSKAPYRNRSKLFRPKTRAAVRKALATAASALFSTSKVVSVDAERDSNPIKLVSAKVIEEVLNYRLDRTATKSGIPWFLMSMGACLDSQLHGICVSKQYWEREVAYEERTVDVQTDTVVEPELDNGSPVFDETGAQSMVARQIFEKQRQQTQVVTKDRPMIALCPPENVFVDQAAPWYNPIQLSGYLSVKWPMTVDEAKAMMNSPAKGGAVEWLEVPDEAFSFGRDDYNDQGVRTQRQGGTDRYQAARGTGSLTDGDPQRKAGDIVWMYENFVRIDGCDYHFWSIGDQTYASKIKPTRDVYPEQFGERPYAMGFAMVEPHNIYPMGPVESWMPMQMEINELVNLRIDTVKQNLSPIAKVRQGSIFDWKQLQHRGGADTTIIVRDPKDLDFVTPPGASAQSYQEMERMNVDFDEVAGTFSTGSVQSNRDLNQTVGGMRLLSGAANAVSEFDLRTWVETWVEPTLRQIVRTIQYYENDEVILALAGDRAAPLFERYGINQITDQDLETEVSVKVNVGIGAADPMQRITKLVGAMQIIANAAPFLDKKPRLKAEEFIPEVLGAAGYNDGMRFFDFEGCDQPPPEQLAAMMEMQLKQAEIEVKKAIADAQNQNNIDVATINGRFELLKELLGHLSQQAQAADDARQQGLIAFGKQAGDLQREQMRGNFAAVAQRNRASQAQ